MHMDNIVIKKAEKEDAEGIQNVFYSTWMETYPNETAGITREDIEVFFKDSMTDSGIQKRVEDIEKIPNNCLFLVAKDSGRVVGICRVYVRDVVNQLQAIYVLSEYQGKGIGSALFTEALKFFDKEKDIIVQVADYNTNAIAFYTKLGFVDTGKRFVQDKFIMPVTKSHIPELEMNMKKASW